MEQNIKLPKILKGRKPLIASISIVVLIITLIFIWLIFFSIYEVKYIYDFNPTKLEVNTKYCIECIGVNSIGQKIRYRDLNFGITLQSAENNVELIGNSDNNKICFKTIKIGETLLLLSSKFSLNPTPLNIEIIDDILK